MVNFPYPRLRLKKLSRKKCLSPDICLMPSTNIQDIGIGGDCLLGMEFPTTHIFSSFSFTTTKNTMVIQLTLGYYPDNFPTRGSYRGTKCCRHLQCLVTGNSTLCFFACGAVPTAYLVPVFIDFINEIC